MRLEILSFIACVTVCKAWQTHLREPWGSLEIQQLDRHWSGVAEPEQQLGGRGAATGENGEGRRGKVKENVDQTKGWKLEIKVQSQ